MPLMKAFIKQLNASNEYALALHMEQYRPLNQQQQQRVFSMFIENQTAQREVASSGKSRQENFTGFIRRYNLKSKSNFHWVKIDSLIKVVHSITYKLQLLYLYTYPKYDSNHQLNKIKLQKSQVKYQLKLYHHHVLLYIGRVYKFLSLKVILFYHLMLI